MKVRDILQYEVVVSYIKGTVPFVIILEITISMQWGACIAYQIDVFSYGCDEHRQKFTFELVFQRYVYVRTADYVVLDK